MIKKDKKQQKLKEEEAKQEWLAARADGSVERMQGVPDVKKLVPQEQDNDIDALRKLRLAQMKGRAAERQEWIAKGHGKYVKLEQEKWLQLVVVPGDIKRGKDKEEERRNKMCKKTHRSVVMKLCFF